MKLGQIYKMGASSGGQIPTDLDTNPIIKLGIQASRGDQFTINNTVITIGYSGLYELDFDGFYIRQLGIGTNGSTPAYYIIDYIQED